MTIGILYESKEWSVFALREHIETAGVPVKLIDLQEVLDPAALFSCSLIVNRVFASAVFRGHKKALEQMEGVIELLDGKSIPMINPAEAHYYETSKARTKEALSEKGFAVPVLYGMIDPAGTGESLELKYPCVVKPDCGGRTNYTFIINDQEELTESLKDVPDVLFIAEEFIPPAYGFVTRIEVIDRECRLAVKRSVTKSGLSAYHLGSGYEIYKDLPVEIRDAAINAMECLHIEVGSLDIIENETGFYIIDVNSVSNVSEDNTEMFDFDLMANTAAYAVERYYA